MSTATPRRPTPTPAAAPASPALVEGQRLDQPAFHERYEAMPPGTRAELIGGVVRMPSPTAHGHGNAMIPLVVWLDHYAEHTPGVEAIGTTTILLNLRNEPEPDLTLRVLPSHGGRTRDEGGYVAGVPEMVVEVSRTSRYVDLGPKFDEYERAGVREYVVRALEPDEVLWFTQENGRFVALSPEDGLFRSRAFPGLWLDPAALLANDRTAVRAALDRGLATPEHAAFAARLAEARGKA